VGVNEKGASGGEKIKPKRSGKRRVGLVNEEPPSGDFGREKVSGWCHGRSKKRAKTRLQKKSREISYELLHFKGLQKKTMVRKSSYCGSILAAIREPARREGFPEKRLQIV